MNELLTHGRRAEPPPAVMAALERLLDARVRDVIVVEHSRLARLHPGAAATTRPRRIYLRGRAADFFADPALMLHEYWHVVGQWECGRLTRLRYVIECCRRGYFANRFEVEARDFAARYLEAFRDLLAQERNETAP